MILNNTPALWAQLLRLVDVPGAVVAGGCIRDFRLDIPAKDIDIFVPLATRDEVRALGDRLGFTIIEVEGDEAKEYAEHFAGFLVGVLEGTLLGVDVNIVARVAHSGGTQSLIESFDFGIVQVAYSELNGYVMTTAFTTDLHDRTATMLHMDRAAEVVGTSYNRFTRFNERNPGTLRLVVPELCEPWDFK